MTEGLVFHHLGVACGDLDSEARHLAGLGYTAEGPDFEDPTQGIRGRFLTGPGPRLELLAALPGSGVLEPWLTGGSRIYHQAFECDDLDPALRDLRAEGARVTVEPVPAVAFGGRNIAFVLLRNMMLIELIEA